MFVRLHPELHPKSWTKNFWGAVHLLDSPLILHYRSRLGVCKHPISLRSLNGA